MGPHDALVAALTADDLALPNSSALSAAIDTGWETAQLRRHYRSRHPSLIELSNRHFYYMQLATPPSPHDQPHFGRNYIQVADGHLASNLTNLREAATLVRAYSDHALENTGQSVAIIANGAPQRDLIAQLITGQSHILQHRLRGEHPPPKLLCATAAQGFEADVIFVSLTAAPPENAPNLVHALTLSLPDGDKTLNVMLSRARDRMDIFCSLLPEHLPMLLTAPRARRRLTRIILDAPAHAQTCEPHGANGFISEILQTQGYSSQTWENTALIFANGEMPVGAIQFTGRQNDLDEKSQYAQLINNGWPVMQFPMDQSEPQHPNHGEALKALFSFLDLHRPGPEHE
ncbi:hypothetical protein GCM10019059_36160 [Camelimonas fluminis]|nr:hypothetical protein GCM10019059_36160 [Camelimonas fluminis]